MSALIFVALAVAWAVYLVPKALKHHDEVARSRTVDRFSQTMRVLARREFVDTKTARLVTGETAPAEIQAEIRTEITSEMTTPVASTPPAELTPVQLRARRA